MTNLWLNLIWKEWREHWWKLIAITAILLGVVALSKPSNVRAWLDMCGPLLWFASAGCAVFVALGAAARENSQATRSYIESQPLAMWKLGLAKLLVGAAVVVLPGLIALGAMALIENYGQAIWPELTKGFSRDEFAGAEKYLFLAAVTSAVALSLFLWTAALGANASNEVRAAGYGLGGIIAWFAVMVAAGYALGNLGLMESRAAQQFGMRVMSLGPLGFVFLHEIEWRLTIPLSCATHAFMAALYVWRFGRPTAHRDKSSLRKTPAEVAGRVYLSAPMQSPLSALAWKGARESLPIVGVGLVGAVGAAVATCVVGFIVNRGENASAGSLLEAMTFILGMFMAWFGGIVAVVIGIGAVLGDLSPAINTFWRSRPIRASSAFWMQTIASSLVLMLVFGLPVELMIGWAKEVDNAEEFPHIFATGLLCAYSLAVCLTTLTRHAIYAAILSFGGVLMAIAAVSAPKWNLLPWANPILLTFAMATLLLAWVCYRRDWSLGT